MAPNPHNTQQSTRVLELQLEDYNNRTILNWENGLSLHSPNEEGIHTYDIFLFVPDFMDKPFSLFQFQYESDATEKFFHLQDRFLPFFDGIKDKNMNNADSLEKFLSIINENPTWTPAHLAAYFNFCNSFENDLVIGYLDTPDDHTGMTPLQIAVLNKNCEAVQKLLDKNCSPYHKDFQDNTVFHYGISSSKEILSVLLAQKVPLCIINSQNGLGYTPMHIACLTENYDALSALLLAGADVNISNTKHMDPVINTSSLFRLYIKDQPNFLKHRNIKCGGTPLHWATCADEIHKIIEYNCDINAVNFENRTALHLMTQCKNFDCIIALLSRGAETNIRDCDGNTPLHLAALLQDNLHILHSLIIFGADVNIVNHNGNTPRHLVANTKNLKALYCLHAVGAERCNYETNDCNDGCFAYGHDDGDLSQCVDIPLVDNVNQMLDVAGMEVVTEKHANNMPNKGRLLSLDGGGIRGLILIQMLLELESAIGKPINHCFDWITGTSTGGVLALGLASGKTAKECLGIYFRMKDKMFSGSRPHPTKPLEEVYKEVLGDDTYLHEVKYPKLIIPCALADRNPIELYLFRNYESPNEILKKIKQSESSFLWHVARATSAAPTYFRPFNNFIDGGLIANNPTLDALTEIQQYNLALRASNREDEQCPVNIIVSLGTGLLPVENTVQLPDALPDVLKLLIEIPGLLSILIKQATEANGRVVERARAWCASLGIPYFRFNPQMSEDVGLNEKCNIKLCKTLWETKAYMYANMPKIKEVADFLRRE